MDKIRVTYKLEKQPPNAIEVRTLEHARELALSLAIEQGAQEVYVWCNFSIGETEAEAVFELRGTAFYGKLMVKEN
jgi:hypothetical protein